MVETVKRRDSPAVYAPRKTVLVCKTEVLNGSETFIRDQILACREWSPILIGVHRAASPLPLDSLSVRILERHHKTGLSALMHRVRRKLQRPNPDAVAQLRAEHAKLMHIHFATDVRDFWPLVRKLRLPMLVTLHGYDITTYKSVWAAGGGGRERYPEELVAIGRSPRVHFAAVSEAIRRCAIDFGLPAERVRVCHIGIDHSQFRPGPIPLAERPMRILFVGRLVEKKGARYLIEAFAHLRQRLPQAQLTIVGDGPDRPALEAQAMALDLLVEFTGALDRSAILSRLQQSRVFCLPSVRAESGDAEGLPIVLLEAQACGVPVVTSAHGGAEDGMRDGETGFAFAEKDVAALTHHLTRLLSDEVLLTCMGAAGRRFIEDRFDIADCTRKLEAYYDEIVAATGPQPSFF